MKLRIQQGFLLLLVTVLLMLQVSADADSFSWYCIRNKAHKQPPIPSEFAFIEELGGYFLDREHGDGEEEKVVYLTFDAGYENGNVAKILDTLQQTETTGAFFVLKHFVEKNGDLVLRMLQDGHLICNHTAHHPDLSHASAQKIQAELEELNACYQSLTGQEMPKYFRPPEGRFSRELLQTVQQLGYKTIFWSFAYADWDNNKQPTPAKAMQCVMDNVHNGAVLLFHPTSATNTVILPKVIEELKSKGYRFGSLEELCAVF